MKKILLIFTLFFFSLALGIEKYSQVRIPVASSVEITRLENLGLAVDHFDGKIGRFIDVFLSEKEIMILKANSIPYSVLIEDWNKYYAKISKEEPTQLHKPSTAPKNFRYGAMGGYLTYDEMVQQIDSMKLLYPNLVSEKEIIGLTYNNRNIYSLKISDNPSTDEDEPEVLYTALHHAREPEGLMTVIYYMWWLLENYGIDPEATYLVNNREMWFIPVVNPDGYVYNQTTNPNGGGMWRENRRFNDSSCYGVDLNRNYGPLFMWNASNSGSSAVPSCGYGTYRGPYPFSEPETQAIDDFMRSHNIKACFNYHTYSNLLIYPWGHLSKESDDSLLYRDFAYDLTSSNRYATGLDLQTVGYSTRGNSDDYMYGDTADGKARTYAMTPEVGISEYDTITGSGFWPRKSKIFPLAEENLEANKHLAFIAGEYLSIDPYSIEGNNWKLTIINKGLIESESHSLYLSTSNGIVVPQIVTNSIPPNSKSHLSFTFQTGNPKLNPKAKIYIMDDVGGAMINDSIEFFVGQPTILLNDSAESIALWDTLTGWNITQDFERNSSVFTDSPNGKYAADTDNSLTLHSPIDLSQYDFAELKFKTKWAIEPTWDFGVVEISTNGGIKWTQLKTKLSHKGSGRALSKQPSGSYGYDGFSPRSSWVDQSIDISSYAGKEILIRFKLSSDGGEQRDGWYLDDITVLGYKSEPNSIEEEQSLPASFTLKQNYPNPFNPTTTFEFSIAENSLVNLSVYDMLGRNVATVVHQNLEKGNHTVNFNAQQLSSGIYFYRLTAGTNTDIKRMVLLK